MRYTGPRNRIARREGMDLGLKTPGSKSHARLLKKLNISPGQHGAHLRRKSTEHRLQLREKQKLRFIFGVSEKQLKKYYKIASQKKGNTALYLAQFLEKRLDNIVFRLGFAPTRNAARQLVSHRHIKIGDHVLNVPSYQVKLGDVIGFADVKTEKIPYVEKSLENHDQKMPGWIEKKATLGKIIDSPNSELIEGQINLRLVIEFYSK